MKLTAWTSWPAATSASQLEVANCAIPPRYGGKGAIMLNRKVMVFPGVPARPGRHCASASSIIFLSSASSGAVRGAKRCSTFPSRSTRYFVKFQSGSFWSRQRNW